LSHVTANALRRYVTVVSFSRLLIFAAPFSLLATQDQQQPDCSSHFLALMAAAVVNDTSTMRLSTLTMRLSFICFGRNFHENGS